MFERDRLSLETHGKDWPLRQHSQIIVAGGLSWHVQVMGTGPVLLMLHGTGASTHTWRALMPELAQHYTIVAPDLPGHGFTGAPTRQDLTVGGMARAVAALLKVLNLTPDLAVGHSAGAAVLIWATLEGLIHPKALIAINGALLPFKGASGWIFPTMARLLFVNPFTPRLFARQASAEGVARLIRQTGSTLDEDGIDYYRRLMRSPAHCAAALGMMANWDLRPMGRLFPRLQTPLHLIVGEEDEAVDPDDIEIVLNKVPKGTGYRLPGLGHLAHEEDPHQIIALIRKIDRDLQGTDSPAA
jgi:magnesium chelatase accessory protein